AQFFCGIGTEPGGAESGCHEDAAGHLTMMAARASRSAVALDLDGDGDLDLVTNEFNARPQVLVSDLAERHHINFLKIRLRGTRSNREGLERVPRSRILTKLIDRKS